jgi:hypothetical protein
LTTFPQVWSDTVALAFDRDILAMWERDIASVATVLLTRKALTGFKTVEKITRIMSVLLKLVVAIELLTIRAAST